VTDPAGLACCHGLRYKVRLVARAGSRARTAARVWAVSEGSGGRRRSTGGTRQGRQPDGSGAVGTGPEWMGGVPF